MQDYNLINRSMITNDVIEMQYKNNYKKVDFKVYQYLIDKLR